MRETGTADRPADRRRRELARQVRRWTVEDFHRRVEAAGVEQLFVVFENGHFRLSHPGLLAEVQAFLELSQDFGQHEGIFIGRDPGLPTLFFAFVHDTRRGLAQGGLRLSSYATLADLLVDGLRLSQGMTRKNALAGLWWGGGKGVLPITAGIDTPELRRKPRSEADLSAERRRLFRAYGSFVAGLKGIYYTAEDVGTTTIDMNQVLSQNRFTTCVSPELGGSGNPSPFTARGVFRAIQGAWSFLHGSDDLRGVRVAVQGTGHVGGPLVAALVEAGAEVWASDVDQRALTSLLERFPGVHAVAADEIYDQEVDIFAPCAIGATVSSDTIPRLRASLICGAANNILREIADAERLRERRIAFVPDFLCNRMGITNCADEWCGYLQEDVELAAERVYPDTLRVLRHAENLVITTTQAAYELADEAAGELHPQLGHRGRRLIDHLVLENRREGARGELALGELPFEPRLDEPELRLRWQREGFGGDGPAIAAAPISAATGPNLSSFFSALLMDVEARAVAARTGRRPRRVVGSDHGGHALQLAVERSLEHERQKVGRSQFVELCRDLHDGNDAALRRGLHLMGVGFDPEAWLDPMRETGSRTCERLFYDLLDAGAIVEESRLAHRCPRCETVLVASEVARSSLELKSSYRFRFLTREGAEIETSTFFPELLVGLAAIAVRGDGRYGGLAGGQVISPLDGRPVPVVAVPELATDAELLVPRYSRTDQERARAQGIADAPPVYDEQGRVRFGDGERLTPAEARRRVLALAGDRASSEAGSWRVEMRRCRRCEAIVHPSFAQELWVRMDEGAALLRARIANGSVVFAPDGWRERVLERIAEPAPWCISRQLWWGNPIPTRPQEVLSTWFSLAAWSLEGAGWPRRPAPEPIARVFVDPERLWRWVLPSLMVALLVTGRPVFRRVDVHGSLAVAERRLVPRPGGEAEVHDEERFLHRTARRPMRGRLGNAVEPGSLVRRFGADALRFGLLLCMESRFEETVLASEDRLHRARRLLHQFVAKLDGVLRLLRAGHRAGAPRLGDTWIVSRAEALAGEARAAFAAGRPADAARCLEAALGAYLRYANLAAGRRHDGSDLGAVRAATVGAVGSMGQAFAPICPFLFEKLDAWLGARRVEGEVAPPSEPWVGELVAALDRRRAGRATIGAGGAEPLGRLESGRVELERLTRRSLAVVGGPPPRSAVIVGQAWLGG